MKRPIAILILAFMLSACATSPTSTDSQVANGKSSTASVDSQSSEKSCQRVTQTGSNMSQRRCTTENRR